MSRRQAIRDRARGMKETPDPTPIHVPGATRPLTLREEMRRFVRTEVSRAAAEQGVGSFEEEDDFDLPPEEADLVTPYTVREMVPEEGPPDELEGQPKPEDSGVSPEETKAEEPPSVQTPSEPQDGQ